MRNAINAFAFLFFVSLLLPMQMVHAQDVDSEVVATATPAKIIRLATVNIYDARIVQQKDSTFDLGFTLNNREGFQSGVKYSVQLMTRAKEGYIVVDEQVYPETLTLPEFSNTPVFPRYIAPKAIDGTYTLFVVSRNDKGLPLGRASFGEVNLVASTKGIQIVPETCSLQVVGEKGNPTYTLRQGVDIAESETLRLTCDAKNTASEAEEADPVFSTHFRTVYGEVVPDGDVENNSLSFPANATTPFSVLLPKAEKPQAYDVVVTLKSEGGLSNGVIVHYVLRGESATVQTVTLDKQSYRSGDTAFLTFFWSAAADNFPSARASSTNIGTNNLTYLATLVDGTGVACAEPLREALSIDSRVVTAFQVTKDCVNPKTEINLVSRTGVTLDEQELAITSPKTPLGAVREAFPPMVRFGILLLVMILVAFVVVRKLGSDSTKGDGSPPKATPIIAVIFLAFVFGILPTTYVHADTFTAESFPDCWDTTGADGEYVQMCYMARTVTFSVNLDNNTYDPGATIEARGDAVSSPGCANASEWHTELIARINSVDYWIHSGNMGLSDWFDLNRVYGTAQNVPGTYNADFTGLFDDPSRGRYSGGTSIPYTVRNPVVPSTPIHIFFFDYRFSALDVGSRIAQFIEKAFPIAFASTFGTQDITINLTPGNCKTLHIVWEAQGNPNPDRCYANSAPQWSGPKALSGSDDVLLSSPGIYGFQLICERDPNAATGLIYSSDAATLNVTVNGSCAAVPACTTSGSWCNGVDRGGARSPAGFPDNVIVNDQCGCTVSPGPGWVSGGGDCYHFNTGVACSAGPVGTPGACGTANGQTYANGSVGYGGDTQCAPGSSTNVSFPAENTTETWYCDSLDGGARSGQCWASQAGTGLNPGACGTANGRTYANGSVGYGAFTQCAPGVSSNTSFPTAGATESWFCNTVDGTSAQCSASQSAPAASGVNFLVCPRAASMVVGGPLVQFNAYEDTLGTNRLIDTDCTTPGALTRLGIRNRTDAARTTWSSLPVGITSVTNIVPRGRASGLSAGVATIHARRDALNGDATLTVTPPVLPNDARCKSHVLSSTTVAPGGPVVGMITMTNNGSNPWTSALSYNLGSQNPQDNLRWGGVNRIGLPGGVSVFGGHDVTFTINTTAPLAEGSYPFDWRMVKDSAPGEWFGETCTGDVVTVANPVGLPGACGPAAQAYPNGSSAFVGALCLNGGTANPAAPVFPNVGWPTTWTCNGTGGSSVVSGPCTATRNPAAPTPPNKPTITGPIEGITNTPYDFTVTATDPSGDALYYNLDWDNNGTVDGRTPAAATVASGVGSIAGHSWPTVGAKTFKAQAVDAGGLVSVWSDPFTITLTVPPIGNFDGINCTQMNGWTCDGDNWNTGLTVHITDGPWTSGVYLTNSLIANSVGLPAVGVACGGGTPNHGFVFPTPASIKNGVQHTLYAYGIDPQGKSNTLLGTQNINCAPPPPPILEFLCNDFGDIDVSASPIDIDCRLRNTVIGSTAISGTLTLENETGPSLPAFTFPASAVAGQQSIPFSNLIGVGPSGAWTLVTVRLNPAANLDGEYRAQVRANPTVPGGLVNQLRDLTAISPIPIRVEKDFGAVRVGKCSAVPWNLTITNPNSTLVIAGGVLNLEPTVPTPFYFGPSTASPQVWSYGGADNDLDPGESASFTIYFCPDAVTNYTGSFEMSTYPGVMSIRGFGRGTPTDIIIIEQ